MSNLLKSFLPFDPSGTAAANFKTKVYPVVKTPQGFIQQIALTEGLFYLNGITVKDGARELVHGRDYQCANYFDKMWWDTKKLACFTILITNKELHRTCKNVTISAHMTGGDFSKPSSDLLPALIKEMDVEYQIVYDNIAGKQYTFPVTSHDLPVDAMNCGFDEVVKSIDKVSKAIGDIPNHITTIDKIDGLQLELDKKLTNTGSVTLNRGFAQFKKCDGVVIIELPKVGEPGIVAVNIELTQQEGERAVKGAVSTSVLTVNVTGSVIATNQGYNKPWGSVKAKAWGDNNVTVACAYHPTKIGVPVIAIGVFKPLKAPAESDRLLVNVGKFTQYTNSVSPVAPFIIGLHPANIITDSFPANTKPPVQDTVTDEAKKPAYLKRLEGNTKYDLASKKGQHGSKSQFAVIDMWPNFTGRAGINLSVMGGDGGFSKFLADILQTNGSLSCQGYHYTGKALSRKERVALYGSTTGKPQLVIGPLTRPRKMLNYQVRLERNWGAKFYRAVGCTDTLMSTETSFSQFAKNDGSIEHLGDIINGCCDDVLLRFFLLEDTSTAGVAWTKSTAWLTLDVPNTKVALFVNQGLAFTVGEANIDLGGVPARTVAQTQGYTRCQWKVELTAISQAVASKVLSQQDTVMDLTFTIDNAALYKDIDPLVSVVSVLTDDFAEKVKADYSISYIDANTIGEAIATNKIPNTFIRFGVSTATTEQQDGVVISESRNSSLIVGGKHSPSRKFTVYAGDAVRSIVLEPSFKSGAIITIVAPSSCGASSVISINSPVPIYSQYPVNSLGLPNQVIQYMYTTEKAIGGGFVELSRNGLLKDTSTIFKSVIKFVEKKGESRFNAQQELNSLNHEVTLNGRELTEGASYRIVNNTWIELYTKHGNTITPWKLQTQEDIVKIKVYNNGQSLVSRHTLNFAVLPDVNTLSVWMGDLNQVPAGKIIYDGRKFSKQVNPQLAVKYPTGVLPDLTDTVNNMKRYWIGNRG